MAEFKEEESASESIATNMEVYAGDTIETKLPNIYDALKKIQRRIIWTLHVDKKKPNEKLKESSLVGRVMEYHPHGDASIAAAVTGMTQPFTYMVPMVHSMSNIGTYSGQPPAAPRYMDVMESDFAKDVYFGDMNLHMLKMVTRETGEGVEPAYLVPRIPMTLFIPSFGIAIAYRSRTVVCSLPELCAMTKRYIELRGSSMNWEKTVRSELAKYMLPDYPINCQLRNSKQLLKNYKEGNFDEKIVVDGVMTVYSDRIVVNTLPPDKDFETVTLEVGKQIKQAGTFENTNFQQMIDFTGKKQGIMFGQFNCVVKRGVNPFDVLASLKRRLQFTSSITPERAYTTPDGKLSRETPLTLLDKWYTVRRAAVLGDLKQTLKQLINEQRKLLALIIIVDHTDEVYQIFKNSEKSTDAIPLLRKRFRLSGMQAEYIAGLSFSSITKEGKDSLLQRLEKIKAEITEFNRKFTRIGEIMIESVDKIDNKYSKTYPRKCIVPKYIGTACYKGTGFIMLESEEEMDAILKRFPDAESIDFELFQSRCNPCAIGCDEDVIGDLPKYFKSKLVVPTIKVANTACVHKDGGAFVIDGCGVVPPADIVQYVPIGLSFSAILNNGERKFIDVTDKVMRKSITASPTLKDVVHVSSVVDGDSIVIHGNTSQPNRLVIERVPFGGKLRKIVVGKWRILAEIPVSDQRVVINIPPELRSRCNARHVVFEKLSSMQPGTRKECIFGRSDSGDFTLQPIRRKSSILLAKFK